jgi:hypothetical protein
MGHANRHLIIRCERARKDDDAPELERVSKLVDESQAACPHPLRDRRIRPIGLNSVTGKYKRGHLCAFCRRCSKIVEYEE